MAKIIDYSNSWWEQLRQQGRIKSDSKVKTVKELYELARVGGLISNPIGQRPPTAEGFQNSKNEGIIKSIMQSVGIGTITVRDISNDEEMRKVYPKGTWLVIDGGHRIRAIQYYMDNKFNVEGSFFKDLDEELQDYLSNFEVNIDVKVCNSLQAIEIFRNLNKTTSVNAYEMIMCDDQSEICKLVRSTVRYVTEYDNKPHSLFSTKYTQRSGEIGEYFKSSPDKRALWSTYVFVVLNKIVGGGNVAAGDRNSKELIAEEYKGNNKVNKKVEKTLIRFCDDLRRFAEVRKYPISLKLFGSFQCVWFELYEQNKEFQIKNMEYFHDSFMKVFKRCEKKDKYDRTDPMFDYCDSFSEAKQQKEVGKHYCSEMGKTPEDYGVLFIEENSYLSKSEREALLAEQGYRCYFDIYTDKCPQQGKRLELDDSIGAHDLARAKGGKKEDAVVSCRPCNIEMAQMSVKDFITYRSI